MNETGMDIVNLRSALSDHFDFFPNLLENLKEWHASTYPSYVGVNSHQGPPVMLPCLVLFEVDVKYKGGSTAQYFVAVREPGMTNENAFARAFQNHFEPEECPNFNNYAIKNSFDLTLPFLVCRMPLETRWTLSGGNCDGTVVDLGTGFVNLFTGAFEDSLTVPDEIAEGDWEYDSVKEENYDETGDYPIIYIGSSRLIDMSVFYDKHEELVYSILSEQIKKESLGIQLRSHQMMMGKTQSGLSGPN